MGRIIVQLIILIDCYSLVSQDIYYSSINGSPSSPEGLRTVIGIFNPITCSKEEIYIDTTFDSPPFEWTEIAVCPDNNFYGITHQGLYQIDVVNRTFVKLAEADQTQRWHQGLFCTKDSILIFGERDIYGYHLSSNTLEHFGRLPIITSIAANLFVYNGKLMTIRNTSLIVVDTINPINSYVECIVNEPSTSAGLLSLTEVAISCDSVAVFAYYTGGEIYIFDPKTCSLTFHCNLTVSPGESFQGSHPNFMFMPPEPCVISIDLDLFDDSLSGIDYSDTIFCNLPSNFLYSTIDIISDKQLDSLKIWIDSGPLEIMIEGQSSSTAILEGSGSRTLKYVLNDLSTINELTSLLSDINLIGTIPAGLSEIKIGFALWAKNLKSDTAYAYITLVGQSISAGEPGSITLCRNDEPIYLSSLLSSSADINGIWKPNTEVKDIFNPSKDNFGDFYYIVKDFYCGFDTSEFNIQEFPKPKIEFEKKPRICPGDTIVLEIEVENTTVIWPDGTIGNFNNIFELDTIYLQFVDEYGCSFYDTVHVSFNNNCAFKDFFIPNVFSPDGNGFNDFWIIEPGATTYNIEVVVYDRWGGALYREKGPMVKWDGTSNNGDIIPEGVYTYSLNVESIKGDKKHIIGDITLIK